MFNLNQINSDCQTCQVLDAVVVILKTSLISYVTVYRNLKKSLKEKTLQNASSSLFMFNMNIEFASCTT